MKRKLLYDFRKRGASSNHTHTSMSNKGKGKASAAGPSKTADQQAIEQRDELKRLTIANAAVLYEFVTAVLKDKRYGSMKRTDLGRLVNSDCWINKSKSGHSTYEHRVTHVHIGWRAHGNDDDFNRDLKLAHILEAHLAALKVILGSAPWEK